MKLNDVITMATHNSYAGGAVGSIAQQLAAGVRGLELDVWPVVLDQRHDFTLGHILPGEGVALGGDNPSSPLFRTWIRLIAEWMSANAGHAPIFLVLDLKAPLGDVGAVDGIDALEGPLTSTFGSTLLPPGDVDVGWPELDDARGRMLVVLSGSELTRRAYRDAVPTGCMFVERQDNEGGLQDVLFYSSAASNTAALRAARGRGQVVRGWQYTDSHPADLSGYLSLPATDTPFSESYSARCAVAGAVR
ncbi:MAG: hypothetical protein ACHREM_03415 [Polyangiales bacterium]